MVNINKYAVTFVESNIDRGVRLDITTETTSETTSETTKSDEESDEEVIIQEDEAFA